MFALRDFGLLNYDVGIHFLTSHQVVMTDESCVVFIQHYQKLIWLRRFATSIKLSVRFKDAENFVLLATVSPSCVRRKAVSTTWRRRLIKTINFRQPALLSNSNSLLEPLFADPDTIKH